MIWETPNFDGTKYYNYSYDWLVWNQDTRLILYPSEIIFPNYIAWLKIKSEK